MRFSGTLATLAVALASGVGTRAQTFDYSGSLNLQAVVILNRRHSTDSVCMSSARWPTLTLFAEWHSAGRGRWATNAWANDLFIAAPLAFNEVPGTEIGAGLLRDLSRNYRASS